MQIRPLVLRRSGWNYLFAPLSSYCIRVEYMNEVFECFLSVYRMLAFIFMEIVCFNNF